MFLLFLKIDSCSMKVERVLVRSYINVIYSNIPSLLLSYKLVLLLNLFNIISWENLLLYSSHLSLLSVSFLKVYSRVWDNFWQISYKMIKKGFYFVLKALFVLEIFTFLSWLFGYAEKWLDRKDMVNCKIFDVTD